VSEPTGRFPTLFATANQQMAQFAAAGIKDVLGTLLTFVLHRAEHMIFLFKHRREHFATGRSPTAKDSNYLILVMV